MAIWNASNYGFSFVISYASRSGPGFHGQTGVVASDPSKHRRHQDWRLALQNARRGRGSVQGHAGLPQEIGIAAAPPFDF
jgi:hypothetical protein